METPVCDFVRQYADSGALRLHMPGHKGVGAVERLDITEIDGADVLYHATGILRRSEEHAAALFGAARTLYSAEGATLAIRAMVCLARMYADATGAPRCILAGRNAHRSFFTAAALLETQIVWLEPETHDTLLSCAITPERLRSTLAAMQPRPVAVYLTSPDYLGHLLALDALAAVCREMGTLLLVDNAHGAYLRFLPGGLHPMEQGADLCCDSAHKTLPVLTGGAYLHLSAPAPALLHEMAEQAMGLFASTSPSYLILQSLDAVNARLDAEYPAQLRQMAAALTACKTRLTRAGYCCIGQEPLKLTIAARSYGYTGQALAAWLAERKVVCEFADPDFVVMMFTPELGPEAIARLEALLLSLPRRPALTGQPPRLPRLETACPLREALLRPSVELPAEQCVGRILAQPGVQCPPAIPIALCGERLNDEAVRCLHYYGIASCRVLE